MYIFLLSHILEFFYLKKLSAHPIDCPNTISNFYLKTGYIFLFSHFLTFFHLKKLSAHPINEIDSTQCIFTNKSCFSSEKMALNWWKRSKNSRFGVEFFNFINHCRRKVVSISEWSAIVESLVRKNFRPNQLVYTKIFNSDGVILVSYLFTKSWPLRMLLDRW